MSYQATEAVLTHSNAEGAARMVMLVLSHHADNNGCNSHPGIGLMCKESKLCERAIKYAIKSLLKDGELALERPSKGKTPASYRINLPIKGRKTYGAPDAPLKLVKGASGAPVHEMHHKQGSTVQMTTSYGANDASPTVQMTTSYGANDDIAYKEEKIEQSWEKPIEERESSNQESLESQHSPLSLALCEICILDPDILSPIRYSDLIAAEKKLSAKQRSPDDVREFGRRWFINDWRGRDKGEPPSLTLVLDEWERVMSGPVSNGETWEQEKARRLREEKQREAVAANGRNGWKF